jgi:hypothetical protein
MPEKTSPPALEDLNTSTGASGPSPWLYWAVKKGTHTNNSAGLDTYVNKEAHRSISRLIGDHNQVGRFNSSNTSHRGAQLNFGDEYIQQGNTVYIDFDWFPAKPNNNWAILSIQDGKTANFGSGSNTYDNRYISFILHKDGGMYYWLGNIPADNGATQNEDAVPITDWTNSSLKLAEITDLQKWYKVKVVINFQTDTISFEIKDKQEGGADGNTLVTKSDMAFAGGVTYTDTVASLRLSARADTSTGWHSCIDNLYAGTQAFQNQ